MKNLTAWQKFLAFYTGQNAGRRTRLGVFELNRDVVNDYWIEDGLPLAGLSVDEESLQIMVGEMTHVIEGPIKVTAHLTSSGCEDGLDILDRYNRVTVLRFEK